VVLQIATPDAKIAVSVEGRTLEPAPIVREIVDPGEIDIAVSAANTPPFTRTEQVGAGKTVTVAVPAFGDGNATPIVSPEDAPSPGSARRTRLLIAYGVAGAGVISLTAGVLVGLKARS